MSSKYALTAVLAGFALIASAGTADAATKTVKDPKDKGSLYPAEVYKRCDIRAVEATVQGNTLVIKVTHRGKTEVPNTTLRLNTKGSKRSDPEYRLDESGGLSKTANNSYTPDVAKTKVKDRKKALEWQVPLKKIGKPKKVGFQAVTCGEGAVDIAPGGNYFDDTGWDGTLANKYAYIKTRN
ncbi:MAG: hypothetical protein R2720_10640 [Candidatus Nanopelagicales bacterium]